MPRRNDNEFRAAAEEIQRMRPQWLVVFGCYSRRFWAFPKFDTREPHVVVSAHYPDALITRMDEAERALRIWPAQEE